MRATTSVPQSGRQAQAARNDERIREAAREVFIADPGAPISAVAKQAGVGISALYRRYRSKEELLQRLAADGLRRYISEVEATLVDDGDPRIAFRRFMHRCLDVETGSLTVRFAGSFTATDELQRLGRTAHAVTQQLLDRTKAAGALRDDIEVGDISLILEQLQAIDIGDRHRTGQLRHRYLTLLVDALQAPSTASLPGPAPTWQEISSRYTKGS